MTPADSTHQGPRQSLVQIAARAHWRVEARPLVQESAVEAVVVVCMAHSLEEARQLAGAHLVALDGEAAGH
jgi:hypothetical protein